MGQVIDKLKELLDSKVILADGSSVAHAQLREDDPSAKLKKLTLTDLDKNILCLIPDQGRKVKNSDNQIVTVCMSPLFSLTGTHGHNRACDGLVLREHENGLCDLVYIELKSDSPSGYEGQFKSTYCFVRYLYELLEQLCDVKMQIGKERFVVFHTDKNDGKNSIKKRGTRSQARTSNQPDNPDKHIVHNDMEIPIFNIF
jgi:hypothetical protein